MFKALWWLLFGLPATKCQHDWQVIDKHIQPPPYDKDHPCPFGKGPAQSMVRMHQGTYVCIMKCTECGEIYKVVEPV